MTYSTDLFTFWQALDEALVSRGQDVATFEEARRLFESFPDQVAYAEFALCATRGMEAKWRGQESTADMD